MADNELSAEVNAALAHVDALRAFGRRVGEVFATGLGSVVAQAPEIGSSTVTIADFEAVAGAYPAADYISITMTLTLPDGTTVPVLVTVPFASVGALLMIEISVEQMADPAFAEPQLEMIAAALRELLDITGLLLFIDELTGAEIVINSVTAGGIDAALLPLADADMNGTMRVDVVLSVSGAEATLAVLVPIAQMDQLLAVVAPPVVEAMPATSADASDAPAMGAGGAGGPFDFPPIRASESTGDDAVHAVRFPPIGGAETGVVSQQIDLLMDVSLRLTVELGRSSMTVEEVLALGPGSVIELDKLAGEPVDVLANDRLIARGEVVVVDENFGVRVTEIMSPRSRAQAMAR